MKKEEEKARRAAARKRREAWMVEVNQRWAAIVAKWVARPNLWAPAPSRGFTS